MYPATSPLSTLLPVLQAYRCICGEESQCTGCGLASLSIDFYDIGYRAGEQAYDILVNGKNPAEMPVEDPQSLTRIYNPQIASDLGITLGDDYQAIEQ